MNSGSGTTAPAYKLFTTFEENCDFNIFIHNIKYDKNSMNLKI